MSNLSASLAPPASTPSALLPGLRASAGNAAASPDTPSFASVLRDKAEKVTALDTPATARNDAPRHEAKSADEAQSTDAARETQDAAPAVPTERKDSQGAKSAQADEGSQESVPADAGADAAAAAQITALMMQLAPTAQANAAATSAEGSGLEAVQHGALVRDLARGHGQDEKNEAGNHGLALALGHAAADAADATATQSDTAGQSGGQGSGTNTPLPTLNTDAETSPPAADALGAGTGAAATTAISAEETSALPAAATQESDFNRLLAHARDAQSPVSATDGATNVHATQTSRTDNSLPMRSPVGHPNWSNELGDKMTWMVSQQRQQADLVLNPPQLGRIEVSLTVNGDQANAVFTSPNAAVREMLENSLPRLREILAGSGLNLGQADVGAQSFAQQQGQNGNTPGKTMPLPASSEFVAGLDSVGGSLAQRSGARVGMVDTFV